MGSSLFSRRCMGTAFLASAFCGLLGGWWTGLASGQTVPIPGTGFNENVVVGVGQQYTAPPSQGGITATMDDGTQLGNNTWYQLGQNTAATSTGLPMNTTIYTSDSTTGGDTYQMQNVGGNNVLFLAATSPYGPQTVTYTLITPMVYPTLSFLGADGNGGDNLIVQLNYVGGGVLTKSLSIGDWFNNGSNTAYDANGRINGNNSYSNVNGSDPRLYYYDLTGLSTTASLASITLTSGTAAQGNTVTAIFAVSGSSDVAWTGSTNNIWSLAGSDSNWNTGGYIDGFNVFCGTAGQNTNIAIANTVQPAALNFTGTKAYSFSGAPIGGSCIVRLGSGAGSVTFGSANTYSGSTTISGGTLTLADPLAVQNSTISLGVTNGLAFATGIDSPTIGGLAGGSNLALRDNASNAVTLSVGNNGAITTYSGVMSGIGGLNVIGGRLALSGSDTYTGPTTVSGGTLQIGGGGGNASINYTSSITDNATLAYSFGTSSISGGTAQIGAVSGSGSLAALGLSITLNGNVTTGGNQAYDAAASGSSSKGVNISNGSYTLATTGAGAGISLTGDVGVTSKSYTANTLTLSTSQGNGPINLNLSVARSNSWSNLAFGGLVANAGTGTITWSGSYGGTSNGATPVTLTAGVINMSSSLAVTSGSAMTLTLNPSLPSTVSGVISGPASLVMGGPGLLAITSANTFTGGLTISGGTVQMNPGGSVPGTITDKSVLSFANASAQVFTNSVSGAGSLVAAGPGALTIAGSQNFTGTTTVSGGTLFANSSNYNVGNGGSFLVAPVAPAQSATLSGSGTIGPVNVASGGILANIAAGSSLTASGNLTFSGGSIVASVSPATSGS